MSIVLAPWPWVGRPPRGSWGHHSTDPQRHQDHHRQKMTNLGRPNEIPYTWPVLGWRRMGRARLDQPLGRCPLCNQHTTRAVSLLHSAIIVFFSIPLQASKQFLRSFNFKKTSHFLALQSISRSHQQQWTVYAPGAEIHLGSLRCRTSGGSSS